MYSPIELLPDNFTLFDMIQKRIGRFAQVAASNWTNPEIQKSNGAEWTIKQLFFQNKCLQFKNFVAIIWHFKFNLTAVFPSKVDAIVAL